MKTECQQIMTLKEYLDRENMRQSDFVKKSGIDRRIVFQAVKLGHLLKINSLGEYCLVPATYERAFL